MTTKLSQELSNKDNKRFISDDSITLNFKNIAVFDDAPYQFRQVTNLHLSHNFLKTLEGIAVFQRLKSLSLSYNRIEDWRELLHISNRDAL